MKPYIWMDKLGTSYAHKDYLKLDKSMQKGLFPLYKENKKANVMLDNLQTIATLIEHLSFKIERVNSIIEMTAELADDPDSGALWTANEYLAQIAQQMQKLSDKLEKK